MEFIVPVGIIFSVTRKLVLRLLLLLFKVCQDSPDIEKGADLGSADQVSNDSKNISVNIENSVVLVAAIE